MNNLVGSSVLGPIVYIPPNSRLEKISSNNCINNQAIFLDRDGTIIKDVGYLVNISEIDILSGVEENIRLLQENFLIIIVTNQAAIARGLIKEEDLFHIHESLVYYLYTKGVIIDGVYSCPHHPEFGFPPYNIHCNCRKPQPGLIEKAVSDFHIDLENSFIIGDKFTDVEAGQRAHVKKTILLKSSEINDYSPRKIKPSFVVESFDRISSVILES